MLLNAVTENEPAIRNGKTDELPTLGIRCCIRPESPTYAATSKVTRLINAVTEIQPYLLSHY